MIAFLYLEIVFGILFDLELVLWSYHSAAAILLTTLWPDYFLFDASDVDLDFSVVPVRIFRNQTPLVFINHIKNTPTSFQTMINTVISGLQGCDAYINDVIVYSDTWDLHVKQLKAYFCRLRDAHLSVNLAKSKFCQMRVVGLVHVISQGEVQPVSAKVQAIVQFLVPTKHELMRYLDMSGYYRKFCHNFSVIAELLTTLLRKNEPFIWSSNCQ